MEDKNSFKDFLKKQTSAESLFKKVPFLLLLICVLLVVSIFKINETNKLLERIADNNINNVEYEKFKDTFIEVETENNKTVEDYLPIVSELHEKDESNTEGNPSNEQETTTKQNSVSKNESTTKANTETTSIITNGSTTQSDDSNISKKTYVITKTKKIHTPSCHYAINTKQENKQTLNLSDEEIKQYKNNGYEFCKKCGGK